MRIFPNYGKIEGNCPKLLWLGKSTWEENLAVTKTPLFAIATKLCYETLLLTIALSRAHQPFPPTHTSLLLFVREIIHPQIWRRTLWFVFKRINLQFHGTGDCYVVVRKNELKARNQHFGVSPRTGVTAQDQLSLADVTLLLFLVRMNYSRVLFSSRTICSDPSETK